jgi:hypothetical protein
MSYTDSDDDASEATQNCQCTSSDNLGSVTNVFHLLCKQQAVVPFHLPYTVVFSRSRPTECFYTQPTAASSSSSSSPSSSVVSRRDDVSPADIVALFAPPTNATAQSRSEIVAQFVYSSDYHLDVHAQSYVAYLTMDELAVLLYETNGDFEEPRVFGVLQAWSPPPRHNNMHRSVWTDNGDFRAVQSRANVADVTDRSLGTFWVSADGDAKLTRDFFLRGRSFVLRF